MLLEVKAPNGLRESFLSPDIKHVQEQFVCGPNGTDMRAVTRITTGSHIITADEPYDVLMARVKKAWGMA